VSSAATPIPRPKMGRLLIVDDDAKIMTALSDTLGQQGHESVGFTSAAEALEALQRQDFDILLTDLQMPEMDGIALLKAALASDPHLVPIVMTGQGTIQTAVKAMQLGAFDYVEKPLKMRDLLPTLTRALEVRQLRRENLQLRETLGVYELSVAIGFTLDIDTILNKVMDAAIQQFGADEVSILLPTPEGKELYVAAARGARRELIQGQRIALDQGIAGWVACHQELVILNGKVQDNRFAPVKPREDIHSAISMPMMVGGKCVGVLNVNATHPCRPFTLGQVKALKILTGTAAPALKAASLHAQVQADKEEWEQSFNALTDYVCIMDRSGTILRANKSMRDRFEPIRGNLVGLGCGLVYCGTATPDLQPPFASVLENGIPMVCEGTLPTLEGWHLISCYPLFDREGNLWGAVSVVRDISQRKRDEETIRETQARFAGILDIAEDAIVSVGDDQRIIVFNQGAEKTFGYSAEDAIGKPLELLLPPDGIKDHSQHLDDFANAAEYARRMGHRRQVLGRRKDGSLFPAEASISKLLLGGKTTFTAILRDVTERQQAEDKLRASEARFRLLVEQATDGIFLHGLDGVILDVNRQACESLGYTRDELIGLHVARIDPTVGPERMRPIIEQLEAGQPVAFDTYHRRKDGSTFPVEVRLNPFHNNGQRVALGVVRDITERRRAEETLRKSELQFRQVWDKSVDGMRLTDPQGIIRMVNDAFCRMVDRPRDALEGKPYTTIYAGPQEEVLADHQERFASRSIEPYFTKEIVLWNGKKTHFELSNSFLELPGQVPQLLSIVRDVTDHKHLEERFRQAQKMEAFGQLAGGVSHDFNNLLTVITGYSEMLLSSMIAADRQRDFIREIRKAGERAASLTRQLLAFSRKQLLKPVELDLNGLISETEKMLRRLIGEDIDLATTLDPTLGRVKADPGQLEQVVMNLVVNARDAMPAGGLLTIETQNVELDQVYTQKHTEIQPGRYVMLAVTDSGCGMDDATRRKIFEPFFTTKEVGKGTGLGLATVHGIVKQSGGSIEVYSEVGRGTTFKIYLPLVNDAIPSRESHTSLSPMPRGAETVLLAEDEEAVRTAIVITLESSGYTVLIASNGEEALQICQQHHGPIHLLVTDVVMPKMSGRQLAESAVGVRPTIKVLFLSGYTDDAIVRHGVLEAGMAFLQKPFTPMVLARKVREVLGANSSWTI